MCDKANEKVSVKLHKALEELEETKEKYLRLGAAMRVMRKEFKEQKKQMSSLKKFYENALQDEKSKNIKLLKQIENQKDQFHVYRQQIDFDKEQLEIQLHEQQKKQLTKPKLQLIIDQLEQDKKRLVELLCTTKEFQTSFQCFQTLEEASYINIHSKNSVDATREIEKHHIALNSDKRFDEANGYEKLHHFPEDEENHWAPCKIVELCHSFLSLHPLSCIVTEKAFRCLIHEINQCWHRKAKISMQHLRSMYEKRMASLKRKLQQSESYDSILQKRQIRRLQHDNFLMRQKQLAVRMVPSQTRKNVMYTTTIHKEIMKIHPWQQRRKSFS